MNHFVRLFHLLEQSRQSHSQMQALGEFIELADSEDLLWAIYLLMGEKPKRCVNTSKLISWALEVAKLPDWLYKECHLAIGDTAETLARILPPPPSKSNFSLSDWMHFVIRMKTAVEEEVRESIQFAWMELDFTERFLLNKWMTAAISLRVDRGILIRALSQHFAQSEAEIAYRLSRDWNPDGFSLERLFKDQFQEAALSKYYPFQERELLLYSNIKSLDIQGLEFQIMGQGIRVQLIVREGVVFLWTENGDLITEIFPEFEAYSKLNHSVVIEAELIGFQEVVLEKSRLERRLSLKKSTKAATLDCPAELRIFDLLEWDREDAREWPELTRRDHIKRWIEEETLPFTQWVAPQSFAHWPEAIDFQINAQKFHSEGLIINRTSSGKNLEKLGIWKNPNYRISAVLTYAIKNRNGQFSEFSFSVWDNGVLIPIGKSHLNLAKTELDEIDLFVKSHIQERFGPVRSVMPSLVFELQFSKIQSSTRHKSGLILQEIRVNQWLKEKKAIEASSLKELQDLIEFIAS
jgi:DNA ligase 1